ncbi:UNVERIFIED_CONTAM: hypothetical protein HDU68_012188 [Siphonaria sp. JEL0065]|nr:hypothetical protein HDU68_012188 [Siphonaria sp. JEL0065]
MSAAATTSISPAPAGWPTNYPWPPSGGGVQGPSSGLTGNFGPNAPMPPGWPSGVPWPPTTNTVTSIGGNNDNSGSNINNSNNPSTTSTLNPTNTNGSQQQPQIIVQTDGGSSASANMGVVLGIVIGILITFILLGLCYWIRQKKKKREYKAENERYETNSSSRRMRSGTRHGGVKRQRSNAMLSQVSIDETGGMVVVDRAEALKPSDAEFMVARVLAGSSSTKSVYSSDDTSTRV